MDIKQVFPPQPVSSMNEQQQLLAAIILNPNEDTPRGMYADWLMEYGDSLDNKLGEYIKLSLELHNHKRNALVRKDDKIKGVEVGIGKGNDINGYDWYKKGIELREQIKKTWGVCYEHPNNVEINKSPASFEVNRGFISSITCTATQFLSVCDKLIWHPSMIDQCKALLCYKGICDDIEMGDIRSNRWTCEACEGTGTIPRPCPLTAHPIREVAITDYLAGNQYTVRIREWRDDLSKKYKIKFITNQ